MADKPQIMTGIPPLTKKTGGRRADWRPKDFDLFIATKGLRYYWSRAAQCPCSGNTQTNQVDPTCAVCNGRGWISFLPDAALDGPKTDTYGNTIELNEAKTAVSIRAWIGSITSDPNDFERYGRWIPGMGKCTAQSHNRLGYRDRLLSRDSTISMTQLIQCDGGAEIIVTGMRSNAGLHTPVAFVNLLRSVATVYKEGTDFSITDDGTISWISSAPDSGTQLTISYEYYPTWVVMDHPYAARDTYILGKTGDKHTRLPIHCTVKLDFLTDDD
jgi:hypothetical protein